MAFLDDEDDPFADDLGDFNPPFDPFGDDKIVCKKSPARTTKTPASSFPLGTTPDDRLEQHALHAICLDGGAAEVICDG